MSAPTPDRPVFDELDRYTDAEFAAAIDAVSGHGSVRFHVDHILYALRATFRPRPPVSPVPQWLVYVGLGVWAVGGIALCGSAPWTWLAGIAGIGAAFIGVAYLLEPDVPTPEPPITPDAFRRMYDRWVAVHGEPEGLIPAARALPGPDAAEELEAYSFDRVVITDRAATAETLLANDFHFENNCAVLSIDGHPPHAFDLVRKMLRTNPHIEVYALHDAPEPGPGIAHRLANEEDWFEGVGRVFDLGLSLDDARRLGAHGGAPIEILTPEQLVKRVFRAMQELPQAVAAGTVVVAGGVTSLAEPGGTSDGGGDSFG